MLNEEQLIERCKKQDKTAQKILYDKYAGLMLGICMRYVFERSEAEDILHEGFIKIYTKIEQTGKGSFEAWMKQVIKNEEGRESELDPAAGVGTITAEENSAIESDSRGQESSLPSSEMMAATLNQGISFLSGLMEMATGQKLLADDQSVTVDKETGEVTMKFKLPGF